MTKKPLVSIIINCHNGARYLKDCLYSIKNQTYQNWEIIFWDNKSSDNSKNIFLSFKNDKRFKYFCAKKFTTLYKARNLALQKSNGEILTFLDTDDYWLPEKLAKQIEIFSKYKDVDLVYSNYFKLKSFLLFNLLIKNRSVLPSGIICNELLKNYSIAWLTIAIRKNKNLKKRLFNEKLDLVSDYDFIIRFSLKKKFLSINRHLAVYREHSGQLTRKKFYNQAIHYCLWYKFIQKNKKINKMINFKFLRSRYNFYRAVKFIFSKKTLKEKIIYILQINGLKLRAKLVLIALFPRVFIKYILST